MSPVKSFLLHFMKRLPKKNLILFESHSDFSDNSRALFEYMLTLHLNDHYRMIWLVEHPEQFTNKHIKNTRFIALIPKTFRERLHYYYYFYTAKYAFFSHRTPVVKPGHGEIFVNLWHGSGPKKTKGIDFTLHFDYVHCSSEFFKTARIKNFNIKPEQILPLGYPRCDLLFHNEHVIKDLYHQDYQKIILWMPTFRFTKSGVSEFSHVNANSNPLPLNFDANALRTLDTFLMNSNVLLILKIHPMTTLAQDFDYDLCNIKVLTNEILQEHDLHLYSVLAESDALITDISSVYVDYLLLNRPIGFTVDDLGDYTSGYIIDDPTSIMPGAFIKEQTDFIHFIQDVINGTDLYYEERIKINDVLNQYHEYGFSKRILEQYRLL